MKSCIFSVFIRYICETESGVMCLDFHPEHPNYIAVGFYDGKHHFLSSLVTQVFLVVNLSFLLL